MAADQRQDFGRIERRRVGDHLPPRLRNGGQRIEARAVRQRRRVHHRVAGGDRIDVGEIGVDHEAEIAVRERGALRPPGRAAGIEDPRRVVGPRLGARHRGARRIDEARERVVVHADERCEPFDFAVRGRRAPARGRRSRSTRVSRNGRGCSGTPAGAGGNSSAPRTSPACHVANSTSRNSGQLRIASATRSPSTRPQSSRSARASRATCAASSP